MSSTPSAWSVSLACSFIDTNILVDADAAFDPRKQQLALDLVVDLRARQEGVLSTQVLRGYFVTARTTPSRQRASWVCKRTLLASASRSSDALN